MSLALSPTSMIPISRETVSSACAALEDSLIDRIRRGDESALSALYSRYSPAVYSLALRIVQQSTVAEDVVQDTFIRAWRAACHSTELVRDPRAWLLRIARNLALDALRRQAVRPQPLVNPEAATLFDSVPDPAPSPDTVLTQAALDRAVRRALATLPDEQREAVRLAFYEGLTHQAIAERTRLPLGTVKTRVRLGLRKLAVSLHGEL